MLKDIDVTNAAGHPRAAMFAMLECCLPNFSCIVGRMDKERDWERLAERARSARGSRSQKAVAKAGGPSHTTLGKIERAEWRPTRGVDDTIDKLEKVYHWAPGSVDNILKGGELSPELRPSEADRSPGTANTDPPGVLHVATVLWGAVKGAAEAAFEFGADPEVQRLNARAVDLTADVLTDFLLSSQDALAAKELVMEMFTTVFELRNRLVGGGGSGDESKDNPVPGSLRTRIGKTTADDPGVVRHQQGN